MYSYLRFRALRKSALEVVVWLAISDIFANATYALFGNPGDDKSICLAQAVSMQFFDMAAILWSLIISFSLYSTVVVQKRQLSRIGMHSGVWGTSLVLSLLPLYKGNYGQADRDADTWCWIDPCTEWG